MRLLEDQVLVGTEAQETRDLIRILVDLFKTRGEKSPVITAADFDISNDKGSVTSLLSSVANQLHRTLLEKARRNLESVRIAVQEPDKNIPHSSDIISALCLRSLSVDRITAPNQPNCSPTSPAASPSTTTRSPPRWRSSARTASTSTRLAIVSYSRKRKMPRAKLLAHARNDKLFESNQDIEQLAAEVRYVIGGSEEVSRKFRVVVLRKNWQSDPWMELPENETPERWDGRLTIIVLPEHLDNVEATLGAWLKGHLPQRRNTIRFLLPKKGVRKHLFRP
jgi:hypothetical protein